MAVSVAFFHALVGATVIIATVQAASVQCPYYYPLCDHHDGSCSALKCNSESSNPVQGALPDCEDWRKAPTSTTDPKLGAQKEGYYNWAKTSEKKSCTDDNQATCSSCLASAIHIPLVYKCSASGVKAAEKVLKEKLQEIMSRYIDASTIDGALDVVGDAIQAGTADAAKTSCEECFFHVMDELADNKCDRQTQCGNSRFGSSYLVSFAAHGVKLAVSSGHFSPSYHCGQAVDSLLSAGSDLVSPPSDPIIVSTPAPTPSDPIIVSTAEPMTVVTSKSTSTTSSTSVADGFLSSTSPPTADQDSYVGVPNGCPELRFGFTVVSAVAANLFVFATRL